jgi:hypothetical protein
MVPHILVKNHLTDGQLKEPASYSFFRKIAFFRIRRFWRHDIRHNDTRRNDIQDQNTHINATQHTYTEHNTLQNDSQLNKCQNAERQQTTASKSFLLLC